MRVTSDYNEKTLSFIEDTEEGVKCECPHCKEEIDITDKDEVCPVCRTELVYPGWCIW